MQNLLNKIFSIFKTSSSFHKYFKTFLLEQKKGLLLLFGTFGVFLFSVFSNMMYRTQEGLLIGFPNAWSDWALHISLTQIFAEKPPSEWFLYHPYFAHGKLTYGFLIHLITGLLVKTGISIETAFFIISILFSCIFLLGFYFLYYQFSKKISVIFLGIFFYFTSAGLGIFRFLSKLTVSDLLNPTIDYTVYREKYLWLASNIPSSMLIPQRAYFIGATIGVWILALVLLTLKKNKIAKKSKQKILLIAGFLAGLLPIAHMHTFISIVVLTGTLILLGLKNTTKKKQKSYITLYSWYVVPATILSTLLFFSFIFGGIEVESFITFRPGWTSPGGILNWIIMWIELWGIFLPLAALATYKKIVQQKQAVSTHFLIGLWLLFILSNLIQFQPNPWDNTKILSWVYLGFSIFIAEYLFNSFSKNLIQKILVTMSIFVLSLSGIVELVRLQNFDDNTFILNSSQEIETAQQLQSQTETDAVFLTALDHNHPISVWAARPMFMGYLGWIRNFGFDHRERTSDAYDIYAGKSAADMLIQKYKISYIYLSNREQRMYRNINIDYLEKFPIVYQNHNTTVFDTRSLWQQ